MTQKIEFKVGLFITITSLLIMASIGYVAYKKGVFSKVYTYTLSSKTGENLTEGMPVVFWGFNIGRVSSMELTDKGVLIQIKIPERHNRVIRANSKFVLDKPLLGSSRIIVTTDNLNDPPLSTKVFPEITVSNDINELIKRIQPIAEKLDRIGASVATLTANLADPTGRGHPHPEKRRDGDGPFLKEGIPSGDGGRHQGKRQIHTRYSEQCSGYDGSYGRDPQKGRYAGREGR